MGRQAISLRPDAADAVTVLGQQIRIARQNRGWTAQELAERIGACERTIRSIERGAAPTSIGQVFNACSVLGIPLFGVNPGELSRIVEEGRRYIALLPKRVVAARSDVRDDF